MWNYAMHKAISPIPSADIFKLECYVVGAFFSTTDHNKGLSATAQLTNAVSVELCALSMLNLLLLDPYLSLIYTSGPCMHFENHTMTMHWDKIL